MDPVQEYLKELRDIRSTGAGVPETSYYPALSNLLNEVGKTLKPRVRCVMQLANRGAGNPDGGLFTPDQLQQVSDTDPLTGQIPARGVIEIKPISDDTWITAGSHQVTKYWRRYGLVLVTNYRDFLIIGTDDDGKPKKFESFRLTGSEKEFWDLAGHPGRTRSGVASRFMEFLKRVILHRAPLSKPEDVAWFLASYARDARSRIEDVDVSTLDAFRAALEEALGMKFEGPDGENLFRSSFIQTLFYGVFSAWVLWAHEPDQTDKSANFDWKRAGWWLHVPMIRVLYEEVSGPLKLRSLDLVEPLDWTAEVLNRVDRDTFFATFDQGEAVQYFYEPFLQQFDPNLRKRYGVWYTPPEIVKYMVARVDRVLREELGIGDGLADSRVLVLDPCCGTGAYLVEVLRKIAETLKSKGGDALAPQDIKHAAMERVFGFEIMPAPFVVAHLQVGLLLQRLGAPLSHDAAERAAVYLTNALTDWEPPKDPKNRILLPLPELQQERDAAGRIKRDTPILVVLGNPPYNAFAGTAASDEERMLIEPYKQDLNKPVKEGGWGIKKFNLDDLYIRFFRLAERRIAELSKRGVVCFISNGSWVSEPSFVVLREHLLASFDKFWIENLHGNRKISEYAPDGRTSETIFAISGFSPGIQQGVATSLWVKSGKMSRSATVLFRDDIDAARAGERREQLLRSLEALQFDAKYRRAVPMRDNRHSFRPSTVAEHYMEWPKVVDLCAVPPSNGLMEKRGGALIDIDRDALATRMRAYFDPKLDWNEYKALGYGLNDKQAGFDPPKARSKAVASERFSLDRIVRYAVRPFDMRWCYYTPVSPVWNRARPSLWAQYWKGNRFLMTRPAGVASPEGIPFFFTSVLGDNDFLRGHAYYFPYQLRMAEGAGHADGQDLFAKAKGESKRRKSVSSHGLHAARYLGGVGMDFNDAAPVWNHVLAVGFSPAYLTENMQGIRQDWPRIPLPASKKQLLHSASLGSALALLLDTESEVKGVTQGTIRPELSGVGVIARAGGGALSPTKGDLDTTVGWGHRGKDGAVMPGKGRLVERDYSKEELEALRVGAKALGVSFEQALAQWGGTTCDVYLNDVAYWKNVPKNVWEYVIGGYQVVKKWLSYRECSILGRGLTKDEAREVTNMCRRIAAILLMQPALDQNYQAVKESCFDWSTVKEN